MEFTRPPEEKRAETSSIAKLYDEYLHQSGDLHKPGIEVQVRGWAQRFDSVFPLVDEDKNGHLSAQELNDALNTKPLTTEQVQTIASLKSGFERLRSLNHDDSYQKGISRSDLVDYLVLSHSYRTMRDTTAIALLFQKVDRNNDRGLSQEELSVALKDPSLSPSEKRFLESVQENKDAIVAAKPFSTQKNVLYLHEIEAFSREMVVPTDEYKLLTRIEIESLPVHNWRTGKSVPLFADEKKPLTSIIPDACIQASAAGGNCQFVAGLGSLASVNRESLYRMIKDNGNNSYTVTFPGEAHRPVTVAAPSFREVDYEIASRYGAWPFVLQKAFGRLRQPDGADDYQGGQQGGRNSHALRALTPSGVYKADDTFLTSYATMSTRISEALSAGRPVQASIVGHSESERTARCGLPKNHRYAVLNIDLNTQEPKRSIVTVQNPWGHLNGTRNLKDLGSGKFSMTLEEFQSEFDCVQTASPVYPRNTIYEWTAYTGQQDTAVDSIGMGVVGTLGLAGAAVFRRSGGIVLGAWSATEMVQDGLTAYKANNNYDRLKYSLGAAADGAMFAGFASRLIPRTGWYGLGIAGVGLVSRWAIQKL